MTEGYHRKDEQARVVKVPVDCQVSLHRVVLLLADEEVDHDGFAVFLVLLAFVDLRCVTGGYHTRRCS